MEARRPKAAAKGGRVAECCWIDQMIKKLDVCVLFQLRERIRQQLLDCSAVIQADQTPCIDHVVDEECLEDATEDLEGFAEELRLAFQNKTLALQRTQLGFHLKNKVNQHDNESRLIIGSMKHITMLSRTVIEYQQRTREKESKLIAIRRKRLSLKNSGEQKVLKIRIMIKKIKEKQEQLKRSKILEMMCRNIQKERRRITVLQNVFQGILMGSGVNWAEDPSLKAVVLQLEKDVSSM